MIPSLKNFFLSYFQQRYLYLRLSVLTVHADLPLGNGAGKLAVSPVLFLCGDMEGEEGLHSESDSSAVKAP